MPKKEKEKAKEDEASQSIRCEFVGVFQIFTRVSEQFFKWSCWELPQQVPFRPTIATGGSLWPFGVVNARSQCGSASWRPFWGQVGGAAPPVGPSGVGGEEGPSSARQSVIHPRTVQTDTPSAIRSVPGGRSDLVAPSSSSAAINPAAVTPWGLSGVVVPLLPMRECKGKGRASASSQ